MGLLSRINNSGSLNGTSKSNSINKNGTGLLARATATTNKTYSSFQEWAKSKGFSHCGIFSIVHGMMVITQAFGLDSQTVANSVSSRDFWKGILSTKAVLNYSKKDNELYNFLQFFSFDLKSSIQHISLLKIKNNSDFSVLMVYNTDSEKEINLTESIENSLKYNSNTKFDSSNFNKQLSSYFLYKLSFEQLIKTSIKSIQLPEANITNAAIKCISEEVFYLVKCAFPSPNEVALGLSNTINLALNNKIADESLMQNHISLLLKEILNVPSQLPGLNSFGTEDNSDTLVTFLEK
ncbi:MAG: hypothetical protein PUD17_05755 [Treponema sp.]|uniref:hypothetical protein n=1 Tax=Treponema sp. TaxID=166 RepID=UPI00298E5C9F|nr:hypothetical protein [Treponema sp.]MDD5811592.1 hypothetical protein [Treponema sp.]